MKIKNNSNSNNNNNNNNNNYNNYNNNNNNNYNNYNNNSNNNNNNNKSNNINDKQGKKVPKILTFLQTFKSMALPLKIDKNKKIEVKNRYDDKNTNKDMSNMIKDNDSLYNFNYRPLMKKINSGLRNMDREKEYKYAVITPYQAQVKKFKEEKNRYNEFYNLDIAINTVDSFQGQERDIVLFSTVRSNNDANINKSSSNDVIGFLSDFRRMNVALSRAKLGCFIVGNSQKFKSDPYWEKLINFCKEKNCFFNVLNKDDFKNTIQNIFMKKDNRNYF